MSGEYRDDVEQGNLESDSLTGRGSAGSAPQPTRSIYALTRSEISKGLANRFVHSRSYVFLYLGMAALSITTIVLSLLEDCPGVAFYVLEVIINASMIIEVTVRFVAFGKQFWNSPFNVVDLILTTFCVLTLVVLTFSGCDSTSKQEELLDTLLLVARNVLQFVRLAAVMRQSGHSIFSRPKPIDLSAAAARRAGYDSLDMDIDDDGGELGRPVVFDAGGVHTTPAAVPFQHMPRATQAAQNRDDEDMWAELG